MNKDRLQTCLRTIGVIAARVQQLLVQNKGDVKKFTYIAAWTAWLGLRRFSYVKMTLKT